MTPALAHRLAEPGTDRALRVALALDRVDAAALTRAGVPVWDAQLLPRRLRDAGELRADGAWDPAARAGYLALTALAAPTEQTSKLLQNMPEQDRPRERAWSDGVESLGDAEVLALVLRTGGGGRGVVEFAHDLIGRHGGLIGLSRMTLVQLAEIDGIGPARASELAAALALGSRLARAEVRERPLLDTPEAVAAAVTGFIAAACARLPHEELWVLPLDSRMRLVGSMRPVTRGDTDGTDAGPRAFFRVALAAGATGAIAVHNHPTGDPAPSPADLAVTRRLVAAGKAIDVPLHDHLVIGAGGAFVSLRRAHAAVFG